MRKPRDFDAEFRALIDKAKALESKKQGQLGELVIATGADALSIKQLAEALLEAVGADASRKEAWRKSGAASFSRRPRPRSQRLWPTRGRRCGSGSSPHSPSGKTGAA